MILAIVLGCILAAAVFAEGGMIRPVWLACQFAAGAGLIAWTLRLNRAGAQKTEGFPAWALALPLYALFQALPLPDLLLRIVSPARAQVNDNVAQLLQTAPPWAPLSVRPEATLEMGLTLTSYIAVYWLAREAAIQAGRRVAAAAAPILLIAAVQALLALEQALSGQVARGSYVNRNHLAGFLELALPFSIAVAIALWRRIMLDTSWKLALAWGATAAASVTMLAAIAATVSRAGLLASLVSLMVLALALIPRRVHRSRRQAITGILLAGVALLIFLPSDHAVRRFGALMTGGGLWSEGRLPLWRETLDLIADYPVAGCGFGAFEAAFPRYKRSAPMVTDRHAHNDYLEALAEGGILGFAILVCMGASAAVRLLTVCRTPSSQDEHLLAAAGLASLSAAAFHGFLDFHLRIPANGFLVAWVAGMCGSLWRPRVAMGRRSQPLPAFHPRGPTVLEKRRRPTLCR